MMNEPRIVIEEVDDPEIVARVRSQHAQARRNGEWLQAHWADVLPEARGRFLAVAGQEAFIADTPEEAWALARSTHPEDQGAFVEYVRPERGPRIYADLR
jgi:hypothetical protein